MTENEQHSYQVRINDGNTVHQAEVDWLQASAMIAGAIFAGAPHVEATRRTPRFQEEP